MRIAYVLARAPFAAQEQFVLTEGAEVVRQGDEVLFLPLRPAPGFTPGTPSEVRGRTLGGRSWSASTLAGAAREVSRRGELSRLARTLNSSTRDEPRVGPGLRNVYAVPRSLDISARLRDWRPDHVHAHFSASTATAAWLIAHRLDVPWSFTAHSPTDITKRNLLVEKTRSASFVRAISEHGRALLANRLPDDLKAKPFVLPMGVSMPIPDDTVPLRFRRSGNERSLVCVGRLLEAKGQEVLLHALAQLAPSEPAIRCHLVGDGPAREDLAATVVRLGLSDMVVMHGYVPNPEILSALSSGTFDVAVLPSASEGVPISLMEPMASGVRVVATDVGGVSELVSGCAGELIRRPDAELLAHAIRRQLDLTGSCGPEIIRDRYCLSRNVAKLRGLFASA